jgi:uncharacterized membrane protein
MDDNKQRYRKRAVKRISSKKRFNLKIRKFFHEISYMNELIFVALFMLLTVIFLRNMTQEKLVMYFIAVCAIQLILYNEVNEAIDENEFTFLKNDGELRAL